MTYHHHLRTTGTLLAIVDGLQAADRAIPVDLTSELEARGVLTETQESSENE
jgi:hypothetical protein